MHRFPPESKRRGTWAGLVIGPALLGLATWDLILGLEPFVTWYYCFAWWAYIVTAETWLARYGAPSRLWHQPRTFIRLLPLSIAVWLIFELFNFRLQNWHYLHLPKATALRWLGYALAFATVLPGLFVSHDLMARFGWFSGARCRPMRPGRHLPGVCAAAGGVLLAAPLAWPEIAFPTLWLGFTLLLEPLNRKLNAPSLLHDLEQGRPERLYRLLAAGLWCGLLWEFWNYWAGSKWIYTLPYLNRPRLFEMPLAGFLGFPPFALECFAMTNTVQTLSGRLAARLSASARRRLAVLGSFAVGLAFLGVFAGIDRFTVRSYH